MCLRGIFFSLLYIDAGKMASFLQRQSMCCSPKRAGSTPSSRKDVLVPLNGIIRAFLPSTLIVHLQTHVLKAGCLTKERIHGRKISYGTPEPEA
jgi:hypothetical protein